MLTEQLLDQLKAAAAAEAIQEAIDSLQLDLEEIVEYQEAKGITSWQLDEELEGVNEMLEAFKTTLKWFR